jgi:hypothetical protein
MDPMDSVDLLLAELLDSVPTTPAVVVNARWDVIASNALARAISPSFQVGVNLAEATFVNSSAHQTLPQWGYVSQRMVGLLKEALDESADDDSRVEKLRAALTERSDDFARAWSQGSTPVGYALAVPMDHPEVGRIEITYEVLRVPDSTQTLVMGHVEPGSSSEQRLFELAARIEP